jgi:hypothetical protein
MKAPLDHLAEADRVRVDAMVERFERAYITRCIEVLGDALASMVDAVDQRIVLEAALMRLASIEADTTPAALLERIERLERALAGGGAPPAAPAAPAASPSSGAGPAAAGRRAITAPPPVPSSPTTSATVASGDPPSRDELTLAWGDVLLSKIPRAAKARYSAGRFVEVGSQGAVFAVPNAPHVAKCEEFREAVEQVLAEHFGRPVPLVLTVDAAPPAPPAVAASAPTPRSPARQHVVAPKDDDPEEIIDVHELEDATPDPRTRVDHLTEAFPGAELLPEENDG